MKFSQRIGKTETQTTIQTDEMSDSFRNRLGNLIVTIIDEQFVDAAFYGMDNITFHAKYCNHFGLKYDDVSTKVDCFKQLLNESDIWHVYDFIEFLISCDQNHSKNDSIDKFNDIFELEKSAYRLDENGKLIAITDEIELKELSQADQLSMPYIAVNKHLKSAKNFFSNRESPDYDKTVIESIHAIEAVCRVITKNKNAVLSDALKNMNLHPALQASLTKLYGFSSDTVRHAKKPDEAPIDENDARFILITSHSIVNYLISKNL